MGKDQGLQINVKSLFKNLFFMGFVSLALLPTGYVIKFIIFFEWKGILNFYSNLSNIWCYYEVLLHFVLGVGTCRTEKKPSFFTQTTAGIRNLLYPQIFYAKLSDRLGIILGDGFLKPSKIFLTIQPLQKCRWRDVEVSFDVSKRLKIHEIKIIFSPPEISISQTKNIISSICLVPKFLL